MTWMRSRPCSPPAPPSRRRASTSCTSRSRRTCGLSSISGGTDIISCFVLGNPALPVYRGEIQCFGLGMDVVAYDEQGRPWWERRASSCAVGSLSLDADRILERPRRQPLPLRLLRQVPGRVVPRRLRRVHAARRSCDLRSFRCGAESGRGAHRDRGDLPAGRAARRGGGRAGHRASVGGRQPHRALRGAEAGLELDEELRERIRLSGFAPTRVQDTCPRALSRCRTSRAPGAARSSSSRCATSCTTSR